MLQFVAESETGPQLDVDRVLAAHGTPESVTEWRELVDTLITPQPCVVHRNQEISALYALMYLRHPELLKWSGMAAFASNHAKILLLPLKLGAHEGVVDLDRTAHIGPLPTPDLEIVRTINNDIHHDIYWAHLAYDGSTAGLERLDAALRDDPKQHGMLRGFQRIDEGRRLLEDGKTLAGHEAIWNGNLQLLWHEQESIVQPRFERFSCNFARIFSLGSSLHFEARGLREQIGFFTSFYTYMLMRRRDLLRQSRTMPRMDILDQRWAWIEARVAPRFRQYESDRTRIANHLNHIVHGAITMATEAPCALDERQNDHHASE